MLHKDMPHSDVHICYRWKVADAAALAALTPSNAQEGKIAWQEDTNDFYVLVDHTGPTWKLLTSTIPGGYAADDIAVADVGTYFTGTDAESVLQEVGLALSTLFTDLGTAETDIQDLQEANKGVPIVAISTATHDFDPANAGKYHRATFSGAKTFTFDVADGFAAEEEYHIRNAVAGDLTLVGTGITLNPPKGGTLVLALSDTVTVKFVDTDEADVFGSTVNI